MAVQLVAYVVQDIIAILLLQTLVLQVRTRYQEPRRVLTAWLAPFLCLVILAVRLALQVNTLRFFY